MQQKRRAWALILGIVGVLLVVASFVWRAVAVDALVKYPDDVDETPVYTGTFTLYVDPATTEPLAEPQEVPLEVRRHVQVVDSTDELAVVKETLGLVATGVFDFTQETAFNNGFSPGLSTFRTWANDRIFSAVGVYKNMSDLLGFGVGDGQYAVTGRLAALPIWVPERKLFWHVGGAMSARIASKTSLNRASYFCSRVWILLARSL